MEMALLIAGMAAVTWLTKFLFMALVSRVSLPLKLTRALGYIPVAILTALVVPGVLVHDGVISLSLANAFIPAALGAALVSRYTGNIIFTMAAGIGIVALLRTFF